MTIQGIRTLSLVLIARTSTSQLPVSRLTKGTTSAIFLMKTLKMKFLSSLKSLWTRYHVHCTGFTGNCPGMTSRTHQQRLIVPDYAQIVKDSFL